MNRKLLAASAVAVLFICLCCSALFCAAALFVSSLGPPEDVLVTVDAPVQIESGERFTILVFVENRGTTAQNLDSIDIDLAYLEGIHIDGAAPPFTDVYSLEPLIAQQSYTFNHRIAPGETLTVELEAVALLVGDYAGQFDICFGSGASCVAYPTRTLVSDSS